MAQSVACTHCHMLCLQTWEDWRQMDVFYLLYDWLLVFLQERLLSPHATHADSAAAAWQQMLWVAALTLVLLLTSATRLVWIALRWCITSGEPTRNVACDGFEVQVAVLAYERHSNPIAWSCLGTDQAPSKACGWPVRKLHPTHSSTPPFVPEHA